MTWSPIVLSPKPPVAAWDALRVVRPCCVLESYAVCPRPRFRSGFLAAVGGRHAPCHLLPHCRCTRCGSWRLSFHVGATDHEVNMVLAGCLPGLLHIAIRRGPPNTTRVSTSTTCPLRLRPFTTWA